jgi:nicotinamidase-related amidase
MCQNDTCRHTAVVITDPYNDFLHPKGKLYGLLADSLKEKDTIAHIKQLLDAARAHNIPVYYGMHQQYKPGNYHGWKHMAKIHESQADSHVFEEGSWGAEFFEGLEPKLENGDVVVSKHWNSSGFQSTDLDVQLHQRDITNLVFCGLTANACMEATARYAYEL